MFEYRVELFWAESLKINLNEFGKKGWELVTANRCIGTDISGAQSLTYECIFKRKICSTDTQSSD